MRKKITLALLSLLLVPLGMMAQDVTISPSTGSLMAALTQEGEAGSAQGWSSTWKHEQLALTLTVSDFCNITKGGEMVNPAGNIILDSQQNLYVVAEGPACDLFFSVSLPKGYKFTGYEIVLLNNITGREISGAEIRNANKIFFETDDLSRNVGTTQMVYNDANDYTYYSTIRDEINANNPHYLAVARKEGKEDGDFRMANSNEGNTEYVITRTSLKEDGSDMSNHLYFRLSHSSRHSGEAYSGVTIKSARFFFTAEGNFDETVGPEAKPASITTTGVNYMYAPFTTGKLDLGDVQLDENNHYTYNYMNVRDLEANNVIYQADAVSGGALPATPGTGGIFGVYNNSNYYYGLKNNTYYVETPITAPTTAGEGSDSPIGFRITGAKVNYAFGQQQSSGTYPVTKEYEGFYIHSSVTRSNNTYNLYLTSSAGVSQNTSGAAIWFIDEDGYIRTGNQGGTYLTWSGTGATRTVSTTNNKSDAKVFTVSGSNINFNEGQTTYYLQGQATGNWTISLSFRFNSNNPNNKATRLRSGTPISISSGSVTAPAFTPAPYTLTVYDQDGTTVKQTVSVSSSNASGTIELTKLNNDAIKFKVEGLEGDDAKALITVELTMQALNPYIDQMSVVVYDPHTNVGTEEDPQPLRLSQGFTASDFSVSGGEFDFYLPGVCAGHEVQITFEDLYSHYADESYTVKLDGFKGSAKNFSRFNFVKSEHFNQFGTTTNNIYSNYNEAATPTHTRVKVGTVGTAPFKFNNAADVSAGRADYFIEYPFSLEAYAAAPNNGSFIEQKFTVSSTVQKQTSYVFTTDETAYNIAPTTATQHRVYAFYKMVTNVKSETYNPQIAFTKIYDKTLYVDSEGKPATDAFYRATVTAVDGSGNVGYATTDDIFKIIDAAVKGTATSGTVTEEVEGDEERTIGTYTGKDAKLASAKQLLCLDFSNLKGVFQVTTEQHGSMEDYSGTNADNCLIFLPLNATAPNNNVAYKTKEGKFRAAHSIVLTDRQPFYSPYDIQVDAAETITYERQTTTDKYGNIQNASMIMPFIIQVDPETGLHTNPDGSSFTVTTMNSTNAIKKDEESTYAYFAAVGNVTTTTANTPYLIKLDEMSPENTIKVVQPGSTIYASTDMGADYTFTGNSSEGKIDNVTVTFTPTGTFAGMEVEKTKNIFYFANNQFVNSADYKYDSPIRVLPFRTFFASSGMTTSKFIHAFDVVFGENPDSETDGIDAMSADVDIDVNAPVFDLQGRKVADGLQNAHLLRGIYVINGVKVIVK